MSPVSRARSCPSQWIGGDARRKCAVDEPQRGDSEGSRADRRSSARAKRSGRKAPRGKPSAATSEQTRLTRNCRARFWAASPPASPPSLAECPQIARSRGTRTSNHLRPRPAPDGKARATLGRRKAQPNRARGWESQEPPLGRARHNANAAKGNAAEPSLGGRTAHFNANAAAPRPRATTIQPPSWDFSRTRSWARIEEG